MGRGDPGKIGVRWESARDLNVESPARLPAWIGPSPPSGPTETRETTDHDPVLGRRKRGIGIPAEVRAQSCHCPLTSGETTV